MCDFHLVVELEKKFTRRVNLRHTLKLLNNTILLKCQVLFANSVKNY